MKKPQTTGHKRTEQPLSSVRNPIQRQHKNIPRIRFLTIYVLNLDPHYRLHLIKNCETLFKMIDYFSLTDAIKFFWFQIISLRGFNIYCFVENILSLPVIQLLLNQHQSLKLYLLKGRTKYSVYCSLKTRQLSDKHSLK